MAAWLDLPFLNVIGSPMEEAVRSAPVMAWSNLGYLIAAVLFIMGIKGMTHPRTAVRGNLLGAIGMALAVLITLWQFHGSRWAFGVVLFGAAIGTVIGVVLALRVQMTQMPQLVALLNGFGGIASVLVAGAEIVKKAMASGTQIESIQMLRGAGGAIPDFDQLTQTMTLALQATGGASSSAVAGFSTAMTGLIGAVTFTGSLVAAGKLHGLPGCEEPLRFDGQRITNATLAGICLILALLMMAGYGWPYWLLILLAGLLGVLLVLPIGGADMPVVIALLNSYSGLAACGAGFVINNNVLIIAGSLVGASGFILTGIMCRAMNRSLVQVLFGTLETKTGSATADEVYAGKIKATSAEEIAMLLDGAQRVVIVPGYGLAVAQAQHVVRELADLLEKRGATVLYGIHPVAGRMPGHMNILLAEAEVPYDQLKEMDEINPLFPQTDVVIVIGANDVVNPVAITDPHSPIAGMPILQVHEAKTVVMIKRSLGPGFAGIPNPLFAADHCLMYFGDGKKALSDLLAAVRDS